MLKRSSDFNRAGMWLLAAAFALCMGLAWQSSVWSQQEPPAPPAVKDSDDAKQAPTDNRGATTAGGQSTEANQDSSNSSAAPVTEEKKDAQPAGNSDAKDDAGTTETDADKSKVKELDTTGPLIALSVGIAIVLGLIIILKINAFIALITAAMVVSLLAPGDWAGKFSRVAKAFGSTAGDIGIVIALAAVIGKCMLDSGAADRVVRAFLRVLGEKRAPIALMGSGFVLAVPVFFDTVFYLLVPLARSMHRRTKKKYLLYILAIGAGGAITHTLVPPTPGPLVMADNLNFDVGYMILVGALVALPAAFAGVIVASIMDRIMKTPMRQVGNEPEPEPLDDSELPSLLLSLLPVILPVLLITSNTIMTTLADAEHAALLSVDDVDDWPAWRKQVQTEANSDTSTPGKRIVDALSDDSRPAAEAREELLGLLMKPEALTDEECENLVDGLNTFILGYKEFHRGEEEDAFLGFMPNAAARSLLSKGRLRMKKVDVERMNRALLETAYAEHVDEHEWETSKRKVANMTSLFGNASFALLLSTIIAMWTLVKQRGLSRRELAHVVELSLMSGGVIILITAAGGAFGKMLTEANVGEAMKSLFPVGEDGSGLMFLLLGFLIAVVLKVAQGSSTVAMITGSAMLAGIADPEILGFHPVYLATSIGAGSLVGSWMNDSGFWIFAKMGGLTEGEALKSWTVMLAVLGLVSFGVTVALSNVLPLVTPVAGTT